MYSNTLFAKERLPSMKIVVIGDKGVGKSSLLHSFTNENPCVDSLIPTIGLDIVTCSYEKMKLKIFDYSGEMHCKSLVYKQCKDADGIILVYDVTNRNSFEFRHDVSVINMMNGIKNEVPLFLIGNKIDKEDNRQVTYCEGKMMAETFAMLGFWETSVKVKNQHVFVSILQLLQEFSEFKEQSKHVSILVKENQFRFNTGIVGILSKCKHIFKEVAKQSLKKIYTKWSHGYRWG